MSPHADSVTLYKGDLATDVLHTRPLIRDIMSTHDCDTIQTFRAVFAAARCPVVHVDHNIVTSSLSAPTLSETPMEMWGVAVSGHCNLAVTPTSLCGNVRAVPKPRRGLAGQRLYTFHL